MPRDAQGAYSVPNGTLVSTGDTVLVSQHNPAMQDIGEALSNSLDRDGKGGMRANLNMGGYRITNAAPGTSNSDLATVGQSMPVGAVIDYAGATAPDGYLMCYGQAISRTAYTLLFAAIGTAYGAGDGTTTFNVPDARGRTSAGKDNMGGTAATRLGASIAGSTLGAVGGGETHTLTVAQLAAHNHPITDPGHVHGYTGPFVAGTGNASGVNISQISTGTDPAVTGITVGNNGSGEAHNNLQPTIIFNKIIKAGSI